MTIGGRKTETEVRLFFVVTPCRWRVMVMVVVCWSLIYGKSADVEHTIQKIASKV